MRQENQMEKSDTGLIIRCIHKRTATLPILIDSDEIPQDREEIPSLKIVRAHPHPKCMAGEVSVLDETAKIQLLICRNAREPLKVQAVKNGPKKPPWAQKLALGVDNNRPDVFRSCCRAY